MEEERLARMAAKKRPFDQNENGSTFNSDTISKKQKITPEAPLRDLTTPSYTSKNDVPPSETIKYPRGTILRTYARHHTRKRDITIEEILQKEYLNTAIISSFTFNLEWLFGKLNTRRTKLILCMSAKGEEERKQWSREAAEVGRGAIKVVFPPLEGEASIMHSKLMILRYDHSLRIVVTSANVELYDHGESGVMENSVFLIDLPQLAEDKTQKLDDLTFFGKELHYFMKRCTFDDKVLDVLLKYDFTATKDIAFVYSAGGASFETDRDRTGFNALARAIRALNLTPPPGSKLFINYISASLGALSDAFLSNFHLAASGKTNSSAPTRVTKSNHGPSSKIRDSVRVLFPSKATVNTSTGGPDNAGTICFGYSSFNANTFPKQILRDYISVRKGMLSHAKTIVAYTAGAKDPSKNIAWAYVGSANFTESAWGKLLKDRVKGEMKLVCRNWECGVVMPVPVPDGHEMKDENAVKLFEPVLDIPCEFPGREYVNEGDPWFFMSKNRWN